MQLRSLRAVVEVVRHGGFSQAARVVHTTQSTVSKAVQALEEEFGERLLDRIGHRSSLTAAGEIVYRRALKLLAERDDLTRELAELKGVKQGALRLGLPPVGSDTLFAPLFVTYRSRFPGIDVQLVEHGSRRLEELLLAGDIDLAGLLGPVDEQFECQEVRREPLMVLVSRDHPLAGERSMTLAQAAQMPFILFEEGFALNPIILNACARQGVKPTVTARSGQLPFIVELAAAGLGVAFLPRLIAEQYERPGISRVLLDESDTEWRLMLAWRRGAYISPAARAWLDLARELHSENPPSQRHLPGRR